MRNIAILKGSQFTQTNVSEFLKPDIFGLFVQFPRRRPRVEICEAAKKFFASQLTFCENDH